LLARFLALARAIDTLISKGKPLRESDKKKTLDKQLRPYRIALVVDVFSKFHLLHY